MTREVSDPRGEKSIVGGRKQSGNSIGPERYFTVEGKWTRGAPIPLSLSGGSLCGKLLTVKGIPSPGSPRSLKSYRSKVDPQ